MVLAVILPPRSVLITSAVWLGKTQLRQLSIKQTIVLPHPREKLPDVQFLLT